MDEFKLRSDVQFVIFKFLRVGLLRSKWRKSENLVRSVIRKVSNSVHDEEGHHVRRILPT